MSVLDKSGVEHLWGKVETAIADAIEEAKKSATGSLQVDFESLGTDDETGYIIIGANKSVSDCINAYDNGVPVYGYLDPYEDSYFGVMVKCNNNTVVFELMSVLTAKRYIITGTIDEGSGSEIWRAIYSDVATEDSLIGTTEEITPTQVKEALLEGRAICLSHTDATYGKCDCNNFAFANNFAAVLSSTIAAYGENYLLIQLNGGTITNKWVCNITQIATPTDIPTDEYINNLIGEKLESANNTYIFELGVSLSASGLTLSLPQGVTYADIDEAVNNKTHVIAAATLPSAAGSMAGKYLFPFIQKSADGNLVFSAMCSETLVYCTVLPDGSVGFTYTLLEQRGVKTQKINNQSNSVEYPSAKAVYDFVIAQTGGLTFKVANSAPTVDDRSVITFVIEG